MVTDHEIPDIRSALLHFFRDEVGGMKEKTTFSQHYLIKCVNENIGGCNPRYFFV